MIFILLFEKDEVPNYDKDKVRIHNDRYDLQRAFNSYQPAWLRQIEISDSRQSTIKLQKFFTSLTGGGGGRWWWGGEVR